MGMLQFVARLRPLPALFLACLIVPAAPADTGKPSPAAEPTQGVDPKSPEYCGACHPRIMEEWKSSEMGRDLANPVVYQFYTATNPKGEKDGKGYQGLFPGKAGECADCHVPDQVIREHKQGREVDLGVAMREKSDHGISCHFCHTLEDAKIVKGADGKYQTRIFDKVVQDPKGRIHGLSARSNAPHPEGNLPGKVLRKSELCGSCHLNQEEKVLAISTFEDWQKAVADGHTRDTCQGCHMPLLEGPQEVAVGAPKKTGVRSHVFPGSHDKGLLEKALDLKLDARVADGMVSVNTRVENVGVGHRVPGSGPIRNVILKIDVTDESGKPLTYAGEPQGLLPPLAGFGNPHTGERGPLDWAGMPGRFYAKVLQTAPNPKTGKPMLGVGGFAAESVAFDTTLEPRKPDVASFRFRLDPAYKGRINVAARLVYRWAFKPLADSKGWKLEDRPMRAVQTSLVVGG